METVIYFSREVSVQGSKEGCSRIERFSATRLRETGTGSGRYPNSQRAEVALENLACGCDVVSGLIDSRNPRVSKYLTRAKKWIV